MKWYAIFIFNFYIMHLYAAQPFPEIQPSLNTFTFIAADGKSADVDYSIATFLLEIAGKQNSDKINCLRFETISSKELEEVLIAIAQAKETNACSGNNQPLSALKERLLHNSAWKKCIEVEKTFSIEDFLNPTDLTILQRFKGFKLNLSDLSLASLAGLHRIDYLSKLEDLDLSYNKLSRLQAYIFSPVKGLTQLALHNNKLESVDRHAFDNLYRLRTLLLRNNSLDNSCLPALTRLTALVHLELDHNQQLNSVDESLLDALTSLTTLSLNVTRVPIRQRSHLTFITQQRKNSLPQIPAASLPISPVPPQDEKKNNPTIVDKFMNFFK